MVPVVYHRKIKNIHLHLSVFQILSDKDRKGFAQALKIVFNALKSHEFEKNILKSLEK